MRPYSEGTLSCYLSGYHVEEYSYGEAKLAYATLDITQGVLIQSVDRP